VNSLAFKGVFFIALLCQRTGFWYGSVVLTRNRLSAFKQAQTHHPIEPAEAHYDLIREIHLWDLLPIQLKFCHVKGYQDVGQTTVLL